MYDILILGKARPYYTGCILSLYLKEVISRVILGPKVFDVDWRNLGE